MKLRSFLTWPWLLGGVLLSPVLLLLGWFLFIVLTSGVYLLLGYHVTTDDEAIARLAMQTNDPTHCDRIRPPASAINTNAYTEIHACHLRLATLTRNPAFCERLMPSEDGLYCVGAVMAEAEDIYNRRFWCNVDEDKVRCYHVDSGGVRTISYDDCERQPPSSLERDWCFVGRYKFMHDRTACSQVTGTDALDACISTQAQRELDDELCGTLSSPVRRSACHVLVKTYRAYPELQKIR